MLAARADLASLAGLAPQPLGLAYVEAPAIAEAVVTGVLGARVAVVAVAAMDTAMRPRRRHRRYATATGAHAVAIVVAQPSTVVAALTWSALDVAAHVVILFGRHATGEPAQPRRRRAQVARVHLAHPAAGELDARRWLLLGDGRRGAGSAREQGGDEGDGEFGHGLLG